MSRTEVHMSKIMEHNIHNQTDSLYNPLRNALKKSELPPQYVSSHRNSFTPQKLSTSILTHNLKMLTPSQIDNIRKTTFISSDRQLIPTHHIEKVRGRHFYAVDIEQKIGDPLSGSQLKGHPLNKFEEIVYEFKEGPPSWLPDNNMSKFKSIYTATSTKYYPQPELVNIEPSGLNPNQTYSIHQSSNNSSGVSGLINSGVKPYQFKDKMKSSKSSSRIQFRGRDDNYKYNLFSMIDEPLNNGCKTGCFTGNQICAGRRATSKWK